MFMRLSPDVGIMERNSEPSCHEPQGPGLPPPRARAQTARADGERWQSRGQRWQSRGLYRRGTTRSHECENLNASPAQRPDQHFLKTKMAIGILGNPKTDAPA